MNEARRAEVEKCYFFLQINREIILVKAYLPSECCNLTNFLKVKRKTLFLLGDSFGLRRSLHPYK